jgi:hypothetical protein
MYPSGTKHEISLSHGVQKTIARFHINHFGTLPNGRPVGIHRLTHTHIRKKHVPLQKGEKAVRIRYYKGRAYHRVSRNSNMNYSTSGTFRNAWNFPEVISLTWIIPMWYHYSSTHADCLSEANGYACLESVGNLGEDCAGPGTICSVIRSVVGRPLVSAYLWWAGHWHADQAIITVTNTDSTLTAGGRFIVKKTCSAHPYPSQSTGQTTHPNKRHYWGLQRGQTVSFCYVKISFSSSHFKFSYTMTRKQQPTCKGEIQSFCMNCIFMGTEFPSLIDNN